MSSLVGGKWVKVSECGQCVGHWRTLSVCCYCTRNLAASLPNLGCPHFAFLPASSSSSVNTIRKIEFPSLSHTHTFVPSLWEVAENSHLNNRQQCSSHLQSALQSAPKLVSLPIPNQSIFDWPFLTCVYVFVSVFHSSATLFDHHNSTEVLLR